MTDTERRQARRSYRSEVRAQQAARTREVITRAARRLFEKDGFAASTIAAIAAEAGVSQQTVYTAFGSKAALVRAIVEQMEESADAAAWRRRIASEEDPARILTAFAQWTRAFFEASSPSFAIAQEAMPELAELTAEGDAQRRRALEALIGRIGRAGGLRDGLPEREAVDRAWLLTGIHPYLDATQACGWTPAAYADWLAESLAQQLLAAPTCDARS
ncbi:TetR/AcrR family transcriptional regulator [Ornithinimicrobium avium]|uniref:TetR/AcrR family transcriptional regulator n=1 Tax=Ornithinimicrobium avium TaxID=2283195 RepID=UPI0013B360E7|nr:TetR/AcrR family transcriptional regulator [Ornithinimicrobium avium]